MIIIEDITETTLALEKYTHIKPGQHSTPTHYQSIFVSLSIGH